ncbi:cupin domain-containing protein (plasmid) [Photobacterium sp. DA100]|uniref:cupin domain-containing protein n=1 Tax=Photobacterium sp. DA100 TaxID=3027472 RepID=UPI00247AE3AF|nr:cupin domain-containing protein [Photobacterium sp. DA100]WEM45067.1 cupin domain-containing protein [Photobacterium sp. DA100]
MKASDGSGYIRTRYPDAEGAWQNSHYHISTYETYIVQSGRILFAELQDGKALIKELTENEVITVKPGVHHNVFVTPNTDLHTVKHGATQVNDWHTSVELDRLLVEQATGK